MRQRPSPLQALPGSTRRSAQQPLAWLAAACAQLAATSALAGGVTFDFQYLGTDPAARPRIGGINASGAVVGTDTNFQGLPFKFETGSYNLLPVEPGQSGAAYGISSAGTVVGSAGIAGVQQAGVFGPAFSLLLGLPVAPNEQSIAYGTDASGRHVIGISGLSTAARGWLISDGTQVDMGRLNRPVAVNVLGSVVGYDFGAATRRALLFSGGAFLDIGTLGGMQTIPKGINDRDAVIGYSALASGTYAPFMFENGSMRELRLTPGWQAFDPRAINNSNQIVGQGQRLGNVAAQLTAGAESVPVNLNLMLSSAIGTTLVSADAINDNGQIAGITSERRGYLLTPTGTLRWASDRNGSFADAQMWDSGLGFSPSKFLNVVLAADSAALTVRADADATMKSLTIGAATGQGQTTLLLAQGARLSSTDAATRVERSGIVMGDGVFTDGLVNRGTLQGTAVTPLQLGVQGTLDNQGLITGSGLINASLVNRGSSPGVRVGAGDLLAIAGTAHSGADGSVLEVRNGGELRIQGVYTAQAGSFIRLNQGTLRTTGLINAGTVQISFGGADIFGDVVNSPGSSTGRIIASGGAPVTFWNQVVNQNEIRASAGAHIVYFGDVSGSGSFTTQGAGAYHRFEAAYNPGVAAAQVEMGEVQFASAVDMVLGGLQAGTGHDNLRFLDGVQFDTGARLVVSLLGDFAPALGQRFQLFSFGQAPSGRFGSVDLPALDDGLAWDTQDLYAGGWLSVSSVPEPASRWLVLPAVALLLRRRLAGSAG